MRFIANEGADLAYVHADHLETPVRMTDDTKAVVWDLVRRPFGDDESLSGAALLEARFPGQWRDPATDRGLPLASALRYNYFRDYDPVTGRYLQPDPIGLRGAPNLYGYVGGNPTGYVDPNGQAERGAAIGGAIGGGIGTVLGGFGGGATGAIACSLAGPGGTIVCAAGGGAEGAAGGAIVGTVVGATIGSAIEDICILISEELGRDSECYTRWQSERSRCFARYPRGADPRFRQGCLDRARYRFTLCIENGGMPNPAEPPEWGPADEEVGRP